MADENKNEPQQPNDENKPADKPKKNEVIAARKFADKTTGKIYEKGANITHLGEKRHEELKKRGFIA